MKIKSISNEKWPWIIWGKKYVCIFLKVDLITGGEGWMLLEKNYTQRCHGKKIEIFLYWDVIILLLLSHWILIHMISRGSIMVQ